MLLDPNPPAYTFPDLWTVAFGEDDYGLWQAFEVNGVEQVLRWIIPGQFLMGSPANEKQRQNTETQHRVTLSKGFWLANTACTQALWQAVMGKNPSRFNHNPEHPVENISWNDCQQFIAKLNTLVPELKARLPTDAEWEYACRAGANTAFHWGDELTTDLANYNGRYRYADGKTGQYRQQTTPVLAFAPNDFGLFQMHGNVWEWCNDWYGEYPKQPVTDPAGPNTGRGRVLRGGSWLSGGHDLRSAYRNSLSPGGRYSDFGLRLAGG